jgi:putative acetyltransferase
MNIAHILPNEKKEISNFFYDVFFQSEGKQEGLTLQELTLQLTDQIQDPSILGIKAHSNSEILGSLFLTQLQFQEGIQAYLLAPVGVHPNHQGKKIGTQLIEHAIQYLKSQDTPFLMTYGDPKYYSRFGFQGVSEQVLPPPFPLSQPEGWMYRGIKLNRIPVITGKALCVEPFNQRNLW